MYQLVGTVSSISASRKSTELFFSFTSFTTPSQIWQCNFDDVDNLKPVLHMQASIPGYKGDTLETRQVFYPSNDGTKAGIGIFKITKVTGRI